MPSELDEDAITEILETYDETQSKSATAEETGRSRGTVRKYVDKYYDDWAAENSEATDDEGGDTEFAQDDGESGDEHPTDALSTETEPEPATGPGPGDTMESGTDQGFTATPPSETPMGVPEEETTGGAASDGTEDPDFAQMGFGEFIEWFFQQQGHGVRQDFADIMSQRCRIKQELPDEKTMKYAILESASGVNNDMNAQMIAENYWAVAQRYLEKRGLSNQQQQAGQAPARPTGGWVEPESNGQQPSQQPQQNGEWVAPEESDAPWEPSPPPQQQRPPVANQNSWMGSGDQQNGQQQGQSDDRMEKLAEALKGMHETQQKLIKEVGQSQQDDGPQPLHQQARELRQAKDELEALTGDDENEEIQQLANHFQNQMERLEAQIEAGNQQQQMQQGEGSDLMALAQLANNENVDSDTLSTIAEVGGVTDPEVKKAEFDLKKEEKKAENRKEMIDSIFENAGSVVEAVTETGIDKMLGGGGGGGGEPQSQQRQGGGGDQPPATRVAEDQPRHQVQETQRHQQDGQTQQPQETDPQGEPGGIDDGYYGGGSTYRSDPTGDTGTGVSNNRQRYEELQQEAEESDDDIDLPDTFEEFADGDE